MSLVKRLHLNSRAEICIICTLVLYVGYVVDRSIGGYADDLIAALMGLVVIYGIWKNVYSKSERCMLWILTAIVFLGILSNFLIGIVTNFSYILNDAFSFVRIYLVYFGFIALLRKNKNALINTVDRLGLYAEAFIIASFMFGILNILGIVKMYSSVRFGFPNYYFIFGNASQYGVTVGCALAFMIFSRRTNIILEGMALATLVLTLKGMGLIIAFVYFILVLVAYKKLQWWHYAVASIGLISILQYQIKRYLFDLSAPRPILIHNGFVTALRYFPFGSGFATFGSNMAAVHYSPLYYEYGFDSIASLAINSPYLNDAYLGMLVGQFGLIGLGLSIYLIWKIGKPLIGKTTLKNKQKYIAIACFSCFCGMAVMAGSVKNSAGEILMMVFALYKLLSEYNDKKIKISQYTKPKGVEDVKEDCQ